MFESIFTATGGLTIEQAAISIGASIVLGAIIALVYALQGEHTKNFLITLAILPVLVQVVIMMVNGNLGTGIAVMGAFSLVRFRSVPGSSKEIISIFFAMAIGLATGMGYISFAVVMTFIIGFILLVVSKTKIGDSGERDKDLRITIPESLNFEEVFIDIFKKYSKTTKLIKVKTTNMGSLYELTYRVRLKNGKNTKDFLDEIRCRNGNLTIICSQASLVSEEL